MVAFSTAATAAALFAISEFRNDGRIHIETARWLLIAMLVLAGMVFVSGLWRLRHSPDSCGGLLMILVVGLLARVILISSDVVFVTDFHRYLWDGATTAAGFNPYTYRPDSILDSMADSAPASQVPDRLIQLGEASGRILGRVNHPHLRTIYPPVAQAIFAISHVAAPWSLAGWRVVLIVFEIALVLLLVPLLRLAGAPLHYIAWYWWNPIVLREIAHSAHLDALVAPFVLVAVLCTVKNRTLLAAAFLAIGAAVKVWPAALLPLVLLPAFRRSRLIAGLLVFVAMSAILWWPVWTTWSEPGNSFVAYSKSWRNNSALFETLLWLASQPSAIGKAIAPSAELMSRGLILALLVMWGVYLAKRQTPNGAELIRRCLWLVAALYLLNPSQFPWYYTWMVPLLCCRPVLPLLSYAAILPLYYAVSRYPWVIWIEHVPIATWLAWCAYQHRKALTSARRLEVAE